MQVAESKMVSINYTLKNDEGAVIDSSEGHGPLVFLHGVGQLIPGLENQLLGRAAGDKLNVTVQPEEAYGQINEQLIQRVPRESFQGVDEIKPGMQFQAETEHGMSIVIIAHVDEKEVVVDGNHPLAGQTLHFDVEVVEVREPTEEELTPAHGCGCGDAGCGDKEEAKASGGCDCGGNC